MAFDNLRLVAVLALVGTSSVSAQQQAPPPSCQAAEYRQFDFWIGTWNVVTASGAQAGRNTIEKMQGCYLHETWIGAGANRGNSYNIYDRTSGKWHQTWVDNGGTLLQIDGGLVDGAMVLEGETSGTSGAIVLNRITWTPFTADSVQQLWETSSDQGSTWTTAFDGRYVRQ